MKNIENTYVNYDDIVKAFGEKIIQGRFNQIYEEMEAFIKSQNLQELVRIDEIILMQAVLDYFSDIYRLKIYHKIDHVNGIKIKAYETHWLVQRKAIQIVADNLADDRLIYVNEKFILSRLVSYLLEDDINKPIIEDSQRAFQNFTDTLYYYLKFRRTDAQAMELMILAFKAGQLIEPEEDE